MKFNPALLIGKRQITCANIQVSSSWFSFLDHRFFLHSKIQNRPFGLRQRHLSCMTRISASGPPPTN